MLNLRGLKSHSNKLQRGRFVVEATETTCKLQHYLVVIPLMVLLALPRERGWIPRLNPEHFVLVSNLFNGLSLHCYIFHKNIQGQHQQPHLEPPQSSSDNTRWISGLLLRTKCPKTEIQQTSASIAPPCVSWVAGSLISVQHGANLNA